MMTLRDVSEWMEDKISNATWRINSYDRSLEKVICTRNLASARDNMTIGGLANKSTAVKGISIIVHWSKNPDETEKIAQSVYELFNGQKPLISGYQVVLCKMRNDEPISLGIDDSGIFDYVIELWITYQRDRKE
jgi:hypothetical protein